MTSEITLPTSQEQLYHPDHVLKYEPCEFQDNVEILPEEWLAPLLCNLFHA